MALAAPKAAPKCDPQVAKAIDAQFARMKRLACTEEPASFAERMRRLDALESMTTDNKERIIDALNTDFAGRGRGLCIAADIYMSLATVREVQLGLEEWMQPEAVSLGLERFPFNLMGACKRVPQPLGVVLVLTPWNFPWHIPCSVLADVLGAGNRAIVKPSEYAPETARLLQEQVARCFDPDLVHVVTGGAAEAAYLAALPFDHIIFVGSTHVGKQVAMAAAPNLTPVTLELGGKNPVFVTQEAVARCAADLATEKLVNAGQNCNCPDTVFLPPGTVDEFLKTMRQAVEAKWGGGPLAEHPQYCSLINDRHLQRTLGLVEEARKHGVRVESLDPTGATSCPGTRKFPLSVIIDPPDHLQCSQEELFSPLIVVRQLNVEDAVQRVNQGPSPLAAYVYSKDRALQLRLESVVRSGGMSVNAFGFHVIIQALPFGGRGASGSGCYHGVGGFRNFSHVKSVYEHHRHILPNTSVPYSEEDTQKIEGLVAKVNVKALANGIRGVGACVTIGLAAAVVAYFRRR